jgi:hypothetical protein
LGKSKIKTRVDESTVSKPPVAGEEPRSWEKYGVRWKQRPILMEEL